MKGIYWSLFFKPEFVCRRKVCITHCMYIYRISIYHHWVLILNCCTFNLQFEKKKNAKYIHLFKRLVPLLCLSLVQKLGFDALTFDGMFFLHVRHTAVDSKSTPLVKTVRA